MNKEAWQTLAKIFLAVFVIIGMLVLLNKAGIIGNDELDAISTKWNPSTRSSTSGPARESVLSNSPEDIEKLAQQAQRDAEAQHKSSLGGRLKQSASNRLPSPSATENTRPSGLPTPTPSPPAVDP